MCGGIGFKISQIPKSELMRFYGAEKAEILAKKGIIESKFWDSQPVLPVIESGSVKLYDWGNRDKNINLPQTGWAKLESVEAGKWRHLHPERVQILVTKGYEKGVWFDIEGNLSGLKVAKDGIKRVYMETKPADAEYQKMTGHDREPIIVKSL